MCAYPKLIAAYHVLHRLLMPRHSPCALCSLTYLSFVIKNFYIIITKNIYSWLVVFIYINLYAIFKELLIFILSPLSDKYYYINIIHICQHFYSFFYLFLFKDLKVLKYLIFMMFFVSSYSIFLLIFLRHDYNI